MCRGEVKEAYVGRQADSGPIRNKGKSATKKIGRLGGRWRRNQGAGGLARRPRRNQAQGGARGRLGRGG